MAVPPECAVHGDINGQQNCIGTLSLTETSNPFYHLWLLNVLNFLTLVDKCVQWNLIYKNIELVETLHTGLLHCSQLVQRFCYFDTRERII